MDLDATVAELLDRHGVPGAAVGVVDTHGVARVVTAGTRGDGCGSVDDNTVFAAASLSKPVFASGVMALVGAGALELDRPLSEYVTQPYLAEDERAASITARMVLSHTTGFPNWRHDGPLFLRWSPGMRWGYSGEGYAYLQEVVEHLVGVDVDRYLADGVLQPLGMNDSSFVRRATDEPRIALGHSRHGQPRPPFRPPRAKAAAGGLFTTAPDYLRFLVHSLTHDHPMFEPQGQIDDELAWGLGWGIEHGLRGRAIWQWGNDPGYKNFVIGRPADRQGVVVLTNGDNGASVYTGVVGQLLPGRHPSLERRHRLLWMMAMAGRPVDLRPRLDDPDVRFLLEVLSGDGHEVEVDRIASRYRGPGTSLLGVVVEKLWEARPRGLRSRALDWNPRVETRPRSLRWRSCPTGAVRASPHHWFSARVSSWACERSRPRSMPMRSTSVGPSGSGWRAWASSTRRSSGSGAGSNYRRGEAVSSRRGQATTPSGGSKSARYLFRRTFTWSRRRAKLPAAVRSNAAPRLARRRGLAYDQGTVVGSGRETA